MSFSSFFLFCFLGLHLPHMEVPRLGRIIAAAAGLHHSLSKAGSLTHWEKSGIEPASSWILVRFITTKPWRELPPSFFFNGRTLSVWKFLGYGGQGLNRRHSCGLCHTHSSAGYLNPLRWARDRTQTYTATWAAIVRFLTRCATAGTPSFACFNGDIVFF